MFRRRTKSRRRGRARRRSMFHFKGLRSMYGRVQRGGNRA